MAFENLSERLQNTIAKLTGKGKVSEADVKGYEISYSGTTSSKNCK